MSVLASLNDHFATLVCPTARSCSLEHARHRAFIVTRLLLSLGTLALAPPCLVLGGAPALWHAAALGWLMLPFAAAIHVSRTGDLRTGEALSVLAWLGVTATVVVGSASPLGFALLLVVALEAAVGGTLPAPSRVIACGAGIAAGVALTLVLNLPERMAMGSSRFLLGLLAGAVAYGFLLAGVAGRARALRDAMISERGDRFRLLADISDDVLLVLDATGTVTEGGAGAHRLFAVKPGDLHGRGLFERILVSDRPLFLKQIADAAADAGTREGVYRLRTGRLTPSEDGTFETPVFAWVEIKARACGPATFAARAPSPGGRAVAVVMRDVSVRKLHERAIDEAEAATRRNNAGRDRFLATVSHELRTPLNAIIGFAEMLSNDALTPRDPEKRREYAGIIQQSGQHLLAVVNTILDASKIEAGSLEIAPEPFDLAVMIDACVGMVGLKAEQAGIGLVTEMTPDLGDVIADSRACKQIVLNLLSNALKFTPAQGRVTVAARPEGTGVLIAVSDTGIGVNARDLPRLGDPFFQARDGIDRDRDGTGLGLSVVRGLVGLHGGSISIESAPGQGTRVAVRLPRDCRRSAQPRSATRIEIVPRSVAAAPAKDAGAMKVSKVA